MAVAALSFYVLGFCLNLGSSGQSFTIGLGGSKKKYKIVLYICSFAAISLVVLERSHGLTGHNVFYRHPIDSLIATARLQHKAWVAQAAMSHDLLTAISEYKRRYNRDPPPGFDVWHKYAVDRSSVVIDDFDSMHNDLAPFWSISPYDLRVRTKQAVFGSWNEVVEVRIRSGSAHVPDMIPTHRWMMEGIVRMMEPFIEHLPDMDLAFNINDEPRVAVPFEKLQALCQTPSAETHGSKSKVWSYDAGRKFDVHINASSQGLFEDWSFRPNFQEYGSVACPSNSPARRTRSWDFSRLCVWCFEPHSVGHFVSDWDLAGSPCHQPDLGGMHGFYKSAAAFKTTKELVPIFSQSKAQGYSDILYPTAWNYNDKIKYEPSPYNPDFPWSQKHETLFWRGSTTEGFSGYGAWRAMVRQRFAFLNNNSTHPLSVFLPLSKDKQRFMYEDLSRCKFLNHAALSESKFSMDTRLTGMTRCGFGDCQREEAQFGMASGVDFQEHWRYKYLMDMDGAGFSGRFLPFLQSRSLPFKTALFREWHDSRIKAWLHFVPVDLRLHGLWSTVAYFAGRFGVGLDWTPLEPGEWIAESGRLWAEKALRKEDMEIYLFRLLLEWGRLTDDRRDSLGFQL
ncbi:MAG: hypothetical protein LQ340_000244 [Diploschistes diacapsis]|nr:MAG: hypothetical protein LQ340_000244 [Diploschistes diacapsis]